MIGGFSTPKKDEALKISGGQKVKQGQILVRNVNTYKAGVNAKGLGTMYAACSGEVYFSKKRTSKGKVRTFINVKPSRKSTLSK
ncbi:MAG: 50S ribosomal protein L27 [Candidatus Omnitrophota bacterium]